MRLTKVAIPRMSSDPHHVRALLLAAVNVDHSDDEIAALLEGGVDFRTLIWLADVHGVGGVVHQRLRRHADAIPNAVMTQLKTRRLTAAARQLQTYQTLAQVSSVLDVPFLTMKGPVLAADWYGDASLRSYADIDILVPRNQFGDAMEALVSAGFEQLSVNWDGFLAYGVAEIPLGHKGSTVDLHWHPIAMERSRRTIDLDVEAVFKRSRRVRLGAVDVSAFDPPDTLLHLCINAGLDGARRLRGLVDVDVIARSDRLDWDVFVGRARHSGAHALCAAILQRAALLVGTPLPRGLLGELAPFAGWLPINALIDRRRRVDRRLGDSVASGLVLASGRATRKATLATLTRSTVEMTRVRLGRPGMTAPGGVLDWKRRPVGGDVAAWRQRYLAWVSGADRDHRPSALSRALVCRTR